MTNSGFMLIKRSLAFWVLLTIGVEHLHAEPINHAFRGVNVSLISTGRPFSPSEWDAHKFGSEVEWQRNLVRSVSQSGFDAIRVRVGLPDLLRESGAELWGKKLLISLLSIARDARLRVVLVVFPKAWDGARWNTSIFTADPTAHKAYVQQIDELTSWIANVSNVYLEPMNEPSGDCNHLNTSPWLKLQEELYWSIRKASPQLGFVVSGVCWSSIRALTALDVAPFLGDSRVLFTLHYYEPHLFTHQGASWLHDLTGNIRGVPWPADSSRGTELTTILKENLDSEASSEAEMKLKSAMRRYAQIGTEERLEQDFDQVEVWRAKHRISPEQLFIGEFGVINDRKLNSPSIDAVRWITAVRKAADKRGYSWAVWEFIGDFGVFCRNGPEQVLCPAYRSALGR